MSATAIEPKKDETRLSQLDQLKKFSKVVADTGDFESMRKYQPQDATTNPSLIYAATQQQQYVHLLDEVIVDRKRSGLAEAAQTEDIIEHLLVKFGCEMLKIVPGRVSTETDARYSFDVEGSIKKARHLVKIYEERGIPRERVLIKIASTWEGINAAEPTTEGRGQMQFDLAVFAAASCALRGGEGAINITIRRPNL
jgi:transaldolase